MIRKRSFTAALWSAALLIAACASAQQSFPETHTAPSPDHPYRPGIDVIDYDLKLELPDRGNVVKGFATLTVQRIAPLDTLVLDLIGLSVDSVSVDGRRVSFRRPVNEIVVPLPRGDNGTFHIGVSYVGPVDDGLIIRTDSAGRWTGFGDNWPNRGRHWIPSVDHPSDKATVAWTIVAPAERTVVANGVLLERTTLSDGRVRTRWRESHPIPVYTMVIAAAPLVEYPLGDTACGFASTGRCVPQYVYTAPEQRSALPGPFAFAGDIVRYFASLVGVFPYERLAHLQSSTRFGGMENSTAIFYSDALFRRGRMSEGLVAHETAHQWFGDAVTERDWAHLWLSEGFATYFAALWMGHAHGDSAFRAELAAMRAAIFEDSDAVPLRPVLDTGQTNLLALLNRNSYEKGGFILHMLRREVGDSVFFGALRRYYIKYRDRTALTDDLRTEIEGMRGNRPALGWFFDQWLRRPGYAQLNVTWSYDSSSHQVTLDVEQGGRFGAYRIPLTMELRDASGSSRRATVQIPAERHSRVVVPGVQRLPPRSVLADPDVELLARIEVHGK